MLAFALEVQFMLRRFALATLGVMALAVPASAGGFSFGATLLSNPLGQNFSGIITAGYEADLSSVGHFGIDAKAVIVSSGPSFELYPHLAVGVDLLKLDWFVLNAYAEVGAPIVVAPTFSYSLKATQGWQARLIPVKGLNLVLGSDFAATILPTASTSGNAYAGASANFSLSQSLGFAAGAYYRLNLIPTITPSADANAKLTLNLSPVSLSVGGEFGLLPTFSWKATAGVGIELSPQANLAADFGFTATQADGKLGLKVRF